MNIYLLLGIILVSILILRSIIRGLSRKVVIEPDGEQVLESDHWGEQLLFVDGTERTIEDKCWLPLFLDGYDNSNGHINVENKWFKIVWLKKVRIVQKCKIDVKSDCETVLYVNEWINNRLIMEECIDDIEWEDITDEYE